MRARFAPHRCLGVVRLMAGRRRFRLGADQATAMHGWGDRGTQHHTALPG